MAEDSDKWVWSRDDVVFTNDGLPARKPLLTKEQIAEGKENLRRIRAGEPLLNGQSPHPKKNGKEIK